MRKEQPAPSGLAGFSSGCCGPANGQASERRIAAAAEGAWRISTQVSHISAEYREHRQAPTLSVTSRKPHPPQSSAPRTQPGRKGPPRRGVKAESSLPKIHQRQERQDNLSGFVLEPG